LAKTVPEIDKKVKKDLPWKPKFFFNKQQRN